MRDAAEKEGAAEEARIKAAAEEDARKIIASAEQEIAAAAKAARRQLTAHAADLAVGLAQKQIHVDAATDQALVRNFAGELGGVQSSAKGRELDWLPSPAPTPEPSRMWFSARTSMPSVPLADCGRLPHCLLESADLRRVWENPAVPAEQKRKLLDAIVQRDGIEKQVRNLIAVLIDHRRVPVSCRESSSNSRRNSMHAWDSRKRRFPAHANWATPKSEPSKRRSRKRPARKSARSLGWTHRC